MQECNWEPLGTTMKGELFCERKPTEMKVELKDQEG